MKGNQPVKQWLYGIRLNPTVSGKVSSGSKPAPSNVSHPVSGWTDKPYTPTRTHWSSPA